MYFSGEQLKHMYVAMSIFLETKIIFIVIGGGLFSQRSLFCLIHI